jgi:preprotein translocase subunit YajC
MFSKFIFALTEATTTTDNTGNPIMTFVVYGGMILIIVGMFFFMNRKQKKQEKQIADMRNALRVGDEVTTTGGIVGRIVRVKEDTVVVETSRDGTKIRFLKSAIARVDVPVEAPVQEEKANNDTADANKKK